MGLSVELTYLGHACFKATSSDGVTLLMDPYTPGGVVQHRPIPDIVDAVVSSHSHPGHSGLRFLQGEPRILGESGYVGTVEATAIASFHDAKKGRRWGPNTVWRLLMDGVSVCHLGDIGHMPHEEQLAQMVPVDILLCPVGGVHSLDEEQAATIIGRINPMVVIPMHYWTPLIGRRLHRLERFLARQSLVVPFEGSTVSIDVESLPGGQPTWVLRPLY
jgi:L-ascorbate metabolism protein UlaG (beta-lactamase superfamily)